MLINFLTLAFFRFLQKSLSGLKNLDLLQNEVTKVDGYKDAVFALIPSLEVCKLFLNLLELGDYYFVLASNVPSACSDFHQYRTRR